jgi:translation initiation factor 3 subunit H
MDSLLDTLEAHRTEENNVAFHARQITREKLRAEQYIQKRKEENATRIAQGLVPLPEEDVSRLFKIPAEPSRLETTLLLGQVDAYAKNLETASAAAIVSLYASQA